MTKLDAYRQRLLDGEDPARIANAESGLPGPRGNLELIGAIAETADEPTLRTWAALPPDQVSGDEPRTIFVVAGVVGLGRFLTDRTDVVGILEVVATDPRWRVREGVAMALQLAGRSDAGSLIDRTGGWIASPDPLVQRAVVAGLCEPALLRDPAVAARVIGVLDSITTSLVARSDRRDDGVRVLRQALGYGWSVAIVHAPDAGKRAFEGWLASHDPDIRWIVRENLKKARLDKLDRAWADACRSRLGAA